MLQWSSAKSVATHGVVTGCDRRMEWMLPWWYGHYQKHNNYKVCFADFGMSGEAQKWCESRGILVNVRQKARKTWFKKPLSMLRTPFDNIIWVDLDCEIRKSLSPLMAYCQNGVGVTLDPHNPHNKDESGTKIEDAVATGVVASYRFNQLILEWANACLDANKMRGDQEVFNQLIINNRKQINIMPPEYQWLRLDGENDDAIMMHWTGSKGKIKIANDLGFRSTPKGNISARSARIKQINSNGSKYAKLAKRAARRPARSVASHIGSKEPKTISRRVGTPLQPYSNSLKQKVKDKYNSGRIKPPS